VYADAEKLEQIILNLLTNAIKFTAAGGSITVQCRADETHAHVAITDTGCGIEANDLERIFDPFVQVDARLTRAQRGVGLGLAISRDLARGMGGDVVVESTPHMGSTFSLSIPLHVAY
jgi:signal transduction histidine kinase